MRLGLDAGAPRAHPPLTMKRLIGLLEAIVEEERTFLPLMLVVRLGYLGLLIDRFFNRIRYVPFPRWEGVIWWGAVGAFTLYLCAFVVLWLHSPLSFTSLPSKWTQIALDTLFFALFFLLNRNPNSNLILVFWLPPYIAARYFSSGRAVAVLGGVFGALTLIFFGGFRLLPPVPGEDHTVFHVFVVKAIFLLCITFPVIRAEVLSRQRVNYRGERSRQAKQRLLLGARLAAGRSPEEILVAVAEDAAAELRAETIAVFRFERGAFRRKVVTGLPADFLPDEHFAVGQGITGQAAVGRGNSRHGAPVRHNKVWQNPRYRDEYAAMLRSHTVQHLLAVPLQGANRTFGILRAVNKLDATGMIDPKGFTDDDQHLLVEIAALYALAYTLAVREEKAQAARVIQEALTAGVGEEGICQAAGETLMRMGYPAGRVLLQDATDQLMPKATVGVGADKAAAALAALHSQRRRALTVGGPVTELDLHRSHDRHLRCWARAHDLRSALLLPLPHPLGAIGLIEVFRGTDHEFTGDETRTLEDLAAQAATAIGNARLAARERERVNELTALQDLTTAALAAMVLDADAHLDRVLKVITQSVCETLGFDLCTVSLVDEDRGIIETKRASGLAQAWQELAVHPCGGDDIQAAVVREGRTVKIVGPDKRLDPIIYERFGHQWLVRVFVPLRGRAGVIGTVEAGYDVRGRRQDITDEEIDLLERLAGQIVLVIENARLLEQECLRHRLAKQRLTGLATEVSSTYHSIGGPNLASARGHLDNILDPRGKLGPLTPEQVKYLRVAQRKLADLHGHLTRLLLVGQLDDGGVYLTRENVLARTLAEAAIDNIRDEAGKKGVALGCEVGESAGRLWVDAGKIRLVLADLLGNAIKFTPEGGRITLRVTGIEGSVRLVVEDTGIGIPPAHLGRIFDKHYQIEPGLPAGRSGHGLGLYLARALVRQHGGEIIVTSTDGRGSVFTVTLPRTTEGG